MEDPRQKWIRQYFENLLVDVSTASYIEVPPTWKVQSGVPHYNRMYYFLQGEGMIQIKGVQYFPKPGQLFILPAGSLIYAETVEQRTFHKYWCHFSAKVGDLHLFQLLEIPPYVQVDNPDYIAGLFRQLTEAHRSQDIVAPLRAKSIMLELLQYYVQRHLPDQVKLSASPNIGKLNEIMKYIDANLAEPLTVTQLAKRWSYHPNYFIRFFKSMLNMSPLQYIHKARIEKAKRLLLSTDKSAAEIAAEVGMEAAYFSRLFKQLTDMSPSDFRTLKLR